MAWSCVPVGLMHSAKRPSELGGGGQQGIEREREQHAGARPELGQFGGANPVGGGSAECGAQKTNTQNTIICRQPDRAFSQLARRNKHSPSKPPDDAQSLWLERYTSDCLNRFIVSPCKSTARKHSTSGMQVGA